MQNNYTRILEAVGLNVQIARKKAGLTQKELAKLSEVSRTQIAKIEQGKVSATMVTLDMICTVLKVRVTKITEPYEDEQYVYKNPLQSRSPKKSLMTNKGKQEISAAANSSHCENARPTRHAEEESFSHSRSCGGGLRCYNEITIYKIA